MERKQTRAVTVGDLTIGGGKPIIIQSMTNTDTRDVKATVAQIRALEEAGCQLVRASVPDAQSAEALKDILRQIHIPLVADIHYDYRLALASIEAGVQGLRINPGNIGSKDRVQKVVEAAKAAGIKMRVGVNGGSLEKSIVDEFGNGANAMVESALKHVRMLEELDFYNTVVSLKASDIFRTIEAYELFSKVSDYPLHLGITEAGTAFRGTVKSAIGIGHLLLNGIGDTIRVSLTADPVEEIKVAREILNALDLDRETIQVISCPTCARTKIDLISLCERVEKKLDGMKKPLTVAIMGCAVNGPGEAKEADIGIAGGIGEALLFKKGKIIRKIKEEEIEAALMAEIEQM